MYKKYLSASIASNRSASIASNLSAPITSNLSAPDSVATKDETFLKMSTRENGTRSGEPKEAAVSMNKCTHTYLPYFLYSFKYYL